MCDSRRGDERDRAGSRQTTANRRNHAPSVSHAAMANLGPITYRPTSMTKGRLKVGGHGAGLAESCRPPPRKDKGAVGSSRGKAIKAREMSDSQLTEMRLAISLVLTRHPKSRCKDIARAIEHPKKSVNSVLYGSPEYFTSDESEPSLWSNSVQASALGAVPPSAADDVTGRPHSDNNDSAKEMNRGELNDAITSSLMAIGPATADVIATQIGLDGDLITASLHRFPKRYIADCRDPPVWSLLPDVQTVDTAG